MAAAKVHLMEIVWAVSMVKHLAVQKAVKLVHWMVDNSERMMVDLLVQSSEILLELQSETLKAAMKVALKVHSHAVGKLAAELDC